MVVLSTDFILRYYITNAAKAPSQLSKTTWECQHVNAESPQMWFQAEALPRGDWKNQRLSRDFIAAGRLKPTIAISAGRSKYKQWQRATIFCNCRLARNAKNIDPNIPISIMNEWF